MIEHGKELWILLLQLLREYRDSLEEPAPLCQLQPGPFLEWLVASLDMLALRREQLCREAQVPEAVWASLEGLQESQELLSVVLRNWQILSLADRVTEFGVSRTTVAVLLQWPDGSVADLLAFAMPAQSGQTLPDGPVCAVIEEHMARVVRKVREEGVDELRCSLAHRWPPGLFKAVQGMLAGIVEGAELRMPDGRTVPALPEDLRQPCREMLVMFTGIMDPTSLVQGTAEALKAGHEPASGWD